MSSLVLILINCICLFKSCSLKAITDNERAEKGPQRLKKVFAYCCVMLPPLIEWLWRWHTRTRTGTKGCAAEVCKTQWKVRAELSSGWEGGWLCERACGTLCECVDSAGRQTERESAEERGCDDSSSTCCLSLALARSACPLSPGDEATFLTSLTRRRSDAKYPI